jgi:hypothetical protein
MYNPDNRTSKYIQKERIYRRGGENLFIQPPLLLLQKHLLFFPALLQVHKKQQQPKAQQTKPKQEIKRHRIISRGTRIDNRTRYNRSDKRRSLADDTE